MFPPIPAWNALHPIVVHFPVALLLVAPLFVLLGLIPGRFSHGFSLAGLGLMLLGTLGAWLAVATGEAAEDFVQGMAGAEAVLDRHEDLAEITRNSFTVLTLMFGALVSVGLFVRKPLPKLLLPGLTGIFLVLYGAACLVLANAAHEGGRLVHEFGARAPMVSSSQTAIQPEDNDSGRGRGRGGR